MTKFVIEQLIKDFFEDSIYKYYFQPEKPPGIKTNYNQVKQYYGEISALIEQQFFQEVVVVLNQPIEPKILTKMSFYHHLECENALV